MASITHNTSWWFFGFLLLVVHLPDTLCTQQQMDFRNVEKQILDQILDPDRYDPRIRPPGINGTNGPVVVRVNIFFRILTKINDKDMDYTTQVTFRQQWVDERLKFNDFKGKIRYLTMTSASGVWMPDSFFSNEKTGHFHNLVMPNAYIRIFPYGSVLYSTRISMKLSCPMNLKFYPHDNQVCSVRMASYGWTTDDLVYLWKNGDPVQVVRNLDLQHFTLEKFTTDYCNSRTNTGEYSCLTVSFLLRREFTYYLIYAYIPCCMLVIVSWLSFWLDQNAIVARVCLGGITILTMIIQTSRINASVPPVSYIKAIDIWTGVCLTFAFGALLESVLVSHMSYSDAKKQRRQTELAATDQPAEDAGTTIAMVPSGGELTAMNKVKRCQSSLLLKLGRGFRAFFSKWSTRSKCLDAISRVIFPLAFLLFVVVYWFTYVNRSDSRN